MTLQPEKRLKLKGTLDWKRKTGSSGEVSGESGVLINVNGKTYQDEIEPRLVLVHYLRDCIGFPGTHIGCETSVCGACTVMLNGQAGKSCTVFAVQVHRGWVLAIESALAHS